jgi:hypothetical protein
MMSHRQQTHQGRSWCCLMCTRQPTAQKKTDMDCKTVSANPFLLRNPIIRTI